MYTYISLSLYTYIYIYTCIIYTYIYICSRAALYKRKFARMEREDNTRGYETPESIRSTWVWTYVFLSYLLFPTPPFRFGENQFPSEQRLANIFQSTLPLARKVFMNT